MRSRSTTAHCWRPSDPCAEPHRFPESDTRIHRRATPLRLRFSNPITADALIPGRAEMKGCDASAIEPDLRPILPCVDQVCAPIPPRGVRVQTTYGGTLNTGSTRRRQCSTRPSFARIDTADTESWPRNRQADPLRISFRLYGNEPGGSYRAAPRRSTPEAFLDGCKQYGYRNERRNVTLSGDTRFERF